MRLILPIVVALGIGLGFASGNAGTFFSVAAGADTPYCVGSGNTTWAARDDAFASIPIGYELTNNENDGEIRCADGTIWSPFDDCNNTPVIYLKPLHEVPL